MIRFSETQEKRENLAPTLEDGFKDIKPETGMTREEAEGFWDKLFSEPIEEDETGEEKLAADVYGRSEEEFTFDFDVNDPELQGILSRFSEPGWSELSEEEKKQAVRDLAGAIEERLGIENAPEIGFYESVPWDCGCYDSDKNTIEINQVNFYDPQEIVDTVAHEVRHAYQYERAQKLETYEDRLYAYNFEHYISPEETEDGYMNFMDYEDQLIEAEARAFASLFAVEEKGAVNE